MDIFAFPPLTFLLDAAYGALAGLSSLLEPLAGASAAAPVSYTHLTLPTTPYV